MANALAEQILAERDKIENTINVLQATAHDRGELPSDTDLETIEKGQARIKVLDRQLEVVGEDVSMDDDTRERLMRGGAGRAPSAPKYRTAGELMRDTVLANFAPKGFEGAAEARERYERHMRAAEHMGTTAEATTPTAGGFGGLQTIPVVGPTIDVSNAAQPFLNRIGKRRAPGTDFARPRIVDPDLKTGEGAGKQTLQKAELKSKKFDVKSDLLTLETYGGYLNVSQQVISLQAAAWDIIITQLQKRVAWQGEAAAILELQQSASEVPLATGAASDVVLSALVDGAVEVWEKTGEFPTWIAFGALGWARLAKLVDDVKRPLFPFLGAQNALGTSNLGGAALGPLGLDQILTPGITNADIWMGNDIAIEAYNYPFPVLEAVEPSVFGRQVAVAEALAFYRPTTTEGTPGTGDGAVRIGPAS